MNTKSTLKALNLLLLLFPAASFAMFGKIQELKKHSNEQQKRAAKQKKLDAELQQIKKLQTETEVDEAINHMKEAIFQEYLNELEHCTGIPHDTWQKSVEGQRKLAIKALQSKSPSTIKQHSADIPESMYNDCIKIASTENVNPDNLILDYKPIDPNDTRMIFASTSGGIISPTPPYFIEHPKITFFEYLLKESKAYQHFAETHELYHALFQHGPIANFATNFTSDIKTITSIAEREANINAAFSRLTSARVGQEKYCNPDHYHIQIINPQHHCYEMTLALGLMEQKDKLSKQNKYA